MPSNELRSWNKAKTTAHFLIHINMQNKRGTKANNPGFGQGFGIGINLYDARNSTYHDWNFIHKPQQRLIKYISPNRLSRNFTNNLHQRKESKMNANLMPYVRAAFRSAIAEGKKRGSHAARLHSENLHDYVVTSVNMGWENSSLHNVEMLINKYTLDYKLTNNRVLPVSLIESEIKNSFKRLLKRNIASNHLRNLKSDVVAGRRSLPSIEHSFLYSDEHITKSIKALYLKILKRNVDSNGLAHHKSYVRQRRGTLSNLERNLKNSREYLSTEVTQMYVQLLKRRPDTAGLNTNIGRIQSGKHTLESLRSAIMTSPEYKNKN